VRPPVRPEELAAFARLAFARRQHAASARLWAEAFAASPSLAADIASSNRFQAARAAALAATEGGPERPPPDGRSPARWREQALAWLEADLAASSSALDSGGAPQRAAVARRLGVGRSIRPLAAIRDEPIPAATSESERRSTARILGPGRRGAREGARRTRGVGPPWKNPWGRL
jgi:serine/threonine-protein kinase